MFRASLCPLSGAYQLQQQPLVYRRNVVVTLLPPHSYGKPEAAAAAAAAVDMILMMGIRMPETCWAVSKRQTVNLYLIAASSWLIHLNHWIIFFRSVSKISLVRRGHSHITSLPNTDINPLKPELNPICYLLALLGAHNFLHVSRIRVKLLTLRWLMSYIYGAPILDVSRSHTTTQHSR